MIPKIIRLNLKYPPKRISSKIIPRSDSLSETESDDSEDSFDYDGPMRFKVESKLNVKRLLQVISTPRIFTQIHIIESSDFAHCPAFPCLCLHPHRQRRPRRQGEADGHHHTPSSSDSSPKSPSSLLSKPVLPLNTTNITITAIIKSASSWYLSPSQR